MPKKTRKKSPFKTGMYLLETLTAGMYNEPLSIYREYIQNAVDSIDLISSKKRRAPLKVDINLDPIKKSITIHDNGLGIPSKNAEKTLSRLGISEKTGAGMRGFRGIGRLGGIAFSDKVIYRTKAKGEKVASVQAWNCTELRELLSDPKKSSMPLQNVFKRITTFRQENSKQATNSFFEVTLEGVSSFRSYNMDIRKVRNYLSQVAPVSFNPNDFSYSQKINDYLAENLSHYGKYEIILNGDPVYKPYRDKVKVTKKGYDYIEDINFFQINLKNNPIAFGWYGQRRDLSGAINRGEEFSGIRVRLGDILLGDAHLLDGCFREQRFNSYIIGEIHVDCPELIPNSRRDDFIDNEMKTLFYNEVEKVVGLPISKEIRLRSRINSASFLKQKSIDNQSRNLKKEDSAPKAKQGHHIDGDNIDMMILKEILKNCKDCPKLFNIISNFTKF